MKWSTDNRRKVTQRNKHWNTEYLNLHVVCLLSVGGVSGDIWWPWWHVSPHLAPEIRDSGIRTKTRGRGEKILSRVRIEEARASPLHILQLPVWSSSRNVVSCVQCPARRVLAMYWQWSVERGSWHQDCGSDNCLVLHAPCTGQMAPKLKHQTMISDQPQQRPGADIRCLVLACTPFSLNVRLVILWSTDYI